MDTDIIAIGRNYAVGGCIGRSLIVIRGAAKIRVEINEAKITGGCTIDVSD